MLTDGLLGLDDEIEQNNELITRGPSGFSTFHPGFPNFAFQKPPVVIHKPIFIPVPVPKPIQKPIFIPISLPKPIQKPIFIPVPVPKPVFVPKPIFVIQKPKPSFAGFHPGLGGLSSGFSSMFGSPGTLGTSFGFPSQGIGSGFIH